MAPAATHLLPRTGIAWKAPVGRNCCVVWYLPASRHPAISLLLQSWCPVLLRQASSTQQSPPGHQTSLRACLPPTCFPPPPPGPPHQALLLQLPLPPPASAISAGKHHGARSTSTPTSALSAALQAPTWQAGPGSDPTILGHNEYTSDGISIGVPDCSGEHGDPRQGRQLGHGPAAALPTASMGPMPLTSPVAASQQLQQLKQQQQQQLQQTFQYHLGWGGSSDLRAKVLDAAMPRGLVVEAVAAAARAVALHPHTSALQREAEAAAASAWASSATSAASSEPSAAAIAPQRESETAMDEGAEGAADAVKAGTGVAPAVEQGQGQGQQVAGSAGGMGTAAVGYGGAAAWAVGRELCAEVVDSLNKHHGPYWQCMAELVGLPNAASAAAASKGGGSSGTGKSMGTSSASVSDSGGTASSSSSSGDGGADGTGADGAGGSGGAVSRGGRLHRGGVCASGAPLEERCRAWRAHEMHVRFVVGAWEFLLFK